MASCTASSASFLFFNQRKAILYSLILKGQMLASKKVFMYVDNGVGPGMLQVLRKKSILKPFVTLLNLVFQENISVILILLRAFNYPLEEIISIFFILQDS